MLNFFAELEFIIILYVPVKSSETLQILMLLKELTKAVYI